MRNGNTGWYIVLTLTFIVWGTQHAALKLLSGEVSPWLLNLLRFSIAWLALLPFVLADKIKIEKKDLAKILFLGLAGPFLFGTLNLIGVKLSTATNSAILVNIWPLIAVILAPVLIKEQAAKSSTLGVIIGFIGVILVVTNGTGMGSLIKSEFLTGNLLLALSALCISLYSIFSKQYIKKYGGLNATFLIFTASIGFMLALSLATGDIYGITKISFSSLLFILWVAIPTTAFTWVIWFKSVDKIGFVETNSFFFLIPLSGILTAKIFLNERITTYTVLGAILIILGIYTLQRKGYFFRRNLRTSRAPGR